MLLGYRTGPPRTIKPVGVLSRVYRSKDSHAPYAVRAHVKFATHVHTQCPNDSHLVPRGRN